MNPFFIEGDSAFCTKGKHKGERVWVNRFVPPHFYICKTTRTNKEILLSGDELETVFQHDKRVGLLDPIKE